MQDTFETAQDVFNPQYKTQIAMAGLIKGLYDFIRGINYTRATLKLTERSRTLLISWLKKYKLMTGKKISFDKVDELYKDFKPLRWNASIRSYEEFEPYI